MTILSRLRSSTPVERVRAFFVETIWEARLTELPLREALRYRAARLIYCTVHGLLFGDRLHVRAAALTYYTVLSIVPLLAFAFALLKGFGVYDALVEQTVRPYLLGTFAGNPALQSSFEHVLQFVNRTGVTSLGLIGLIALLYTATRLLRNIEGALNELWHTRHGRTPLQQLRDYVSIIVVTPLCLVLAGGLGTFTQLIELLRALQEKLGVGALIERAVGALGPLLIAFTGLFFLYRVMPNAHVRTRSAAIGAAVGGVLWYAALIVHVRFQVGVARFNAIYAGFGAIPIFLVWTHVSWLAVMVGAQIASMHQHEGAQRQRRRAQETGPVLRQALCMSIMVRIGRALLHGEHAPTLSVLTRAFDAPEPLICELLERMVAAGLLQATGSPEDPRWLLARLPEHVRAKDVLDALHETSAQRREALARRRELEPAAVALLCDFDSELTTSAANATLRELAARSASTGAGASAQTST
jgi:membrane protein